MTASLLFGLILGLGAAIPFARSGKPVGGAFRLALMATAIGAALFGAGMAAMSPQEHFNGEVHWAAILGVLPLFLGGVALVVILLVMALRWIGYGPEEEEQ